MKYLIRVFLFNLFGLWIVSQVLPTLVISGSWQVLVLAGATLSFLMVIVKPILKILFIPINLLTFGLLSWFINVIVIYILTIVVPEVSIRSWTFPGATWAGFVIPQIQLNYFFALVVTSLFITFATNILHQLSES